MQDMCLLPQQIKTLILENKVTLCKYSILRNKEKLQSLETTVAVAYVGPEPSMKIRPFSEAWSIA